MRNLSKTFLLIGAIFAIIGIFALIGASVAFFYVGTAKDTEFIKEGFQNIWDQIPGETDADRIAFVQLLANSLGMVLVVAGVLSIPTIVVSFIARGNHATGLFVAAIVLSAVLAGNVFIILGAIFGLVANSKERNQQINSAY